MNEPNLCPACLIELPDGYPFDHVAIDRALAGDRDLFASMDTAARREVVIVGLARGVTLLDLAELLAWGYAPLQALLPDEHPESRVARAAEGERVVREMWGQGLLDVTISARTGMNPSQVGRIRKRLGLATLRRAGDLHARRWKRAAA